MEGPGPWYRDMIVGDRAAGRRVDSYLAARFVGLSRTEVAGFIRHGAICSEERALKPSSRLRLGERLRLYVPGLAPRQAPPPLPPVLYEDARLLVLDKPAGLLCHPSGERWAYAIIGLARRERPDHRIDLVHRLDRDTSGVLVLTKDRAANVFLKEAVRNRHVHKTYQAIARGSVPWEEREVRAPIGPGTAEIKLRRAVVPGGQRAHTTVRVLQRLSGLTLVELVLHTGRTHQIRVHMEHLGFPLLGDKIYGQPDAVFLHSLEHGDDAVVRRALGFPRQALHCASMTFPLPDHGALTVRAPLASDLKALVDGVAPSWPDSEVDE